MPALPTPRGKHLAAAWTLHARPEAVRLGAPAFARLIGALWQSNPPLWLRTAARADFTAAHFECSARLASSPVPSPEGLQALPQPFANYLV
jgi:hypothetical protein